MKLSEYFSFKPEKIDVTIEVTVNTMAATGLTVEKIKKILMSPEGFDMLQKMGSNPKIKSVRKAKVPK